MLNLPEKLVVGAVLISLAAPVHAEHAFFPDDCVCSEQYDPVCADDGRTYSNACKAHCAGAHFDYSGHCTKLTVTSQPKPAPDFSPAPTIVPLPTQQARTYHSPEPIPPATPLYKPVELWLINIHRWILRLFGLSP